MTAFQYHRNLRPLGQQPALQFLEQATQQIETQKHLADQPASGAE